MGFIADLIQLSVLFMFIFIYVDIILRIPECITGTFLKNRDMLKMFPILMSFQYIASLMN